MADPTVWTAYSQTGVHPNPFDGTDALSWILGFPSNDVLFLNKILGRQALHCRDARADRFLELVTRRDLEHTARTPEPVRSKGGVVFEALQETHPPLARLCADFSRQAGRVSYANVHLDSAAATASRPDWQPHDLFVLQLEGSRRWRLYEGGVTLPPVKLRYGGSFAPPSPVAAEFELTSGDALYVPPGMTFARASCEEVSMHIEVVLIPFTWGEFLEECLDELYGRSDPWRENLPFGYGLQEAADFAPLREEFKRRLAAMSFDLDAATILQKRVDELK